MSALHYVLRYVVVVAVDTFECNQESLAVL